MINPLVYMLFMTFSALIIFGIFIRNRLEIDWMTPWRKEKKHVLAGAIFASVNYPLLLFALTLTNASYVVSFRQIGVIFAVIIGNYWFKEKSSKIRLIAASLIFLGAVLIAI